MLYFVLFKKHKVQLTDAQICSQITFIKIIKCISQKQSRISPKYDQKLCDSCGQGAEEIWPSYVEQKYILVFIANYQ